MKLKQNRSLLLAYAFNNFSILSFIPYIVFQLAKVHKKEVDPQSFHTRLHQHSTNHMILYNLKIQNLKYFNSLPIEVLIYTFASLTHTYNAHSIQIK